MSLVSILLKFYPQMTSDRYLNIQKKKLYHVLSNKVQRSILVNLYFFEVLTIEKELYQIQIDFIFILRNKIVNVQNVLITISKVYNVINNFDYIIIDYYYGTTNINTKWNFMIELLYFTDGIYVLCYLNYFHYHKK